jgi:multiple sugar transport system substrate-binding protein
VPIRRRAAHTARVRPSGRALRALRLLALLAFFPGCGGGDEAGPPTLRWYSFVEPSGAFDAAARRCGEASGGRYRVVLAPLPADADQQREQLARRLAARDDAIDLVAMDVIWTAEFAEAGWILPFDEARAADARRGRLPAAVETASYRGRLWAAPFTSNTQLLWYRRDRVAEPPRTWEALIRTAERLGPDGTIEVQGERYEGLTVFFVSLLASAGGSVLSPDGSEVSLAEAPTRRALEVMRELARSPAASPSLSTTKENEARLAFESGGSSFMVNYTFVWPSAQRNAPELARRMGWARWPRVDPALPSRVAVGGVNLGVAAFGRHPALAFEAATCLASEESQRLAAVRGGLLPSSESLYDDPQVEAAFPFSALLRETLRDAVLRPQTPLYADVSLAIARTLHPLAAIEPAADVARLRDAVGRALRSEGLL